MTLKDSFILGTFRKQKHTSSINTCRTDSLNETFLYYHTQLLAAFGCRGLTPANLDKPRWGLIWSLSRHSCPWAPVVVATSAYHPWDPPGFSASCWQTEYLWWFPTGLQSTILGFSFLLFFFFSWGFYLHFLISLVLLFLIGTSTSCLHSHKNQNNPQTLHQLQSLVQSHSPCPHHCGSSWVIPWHALLLFFSGNTVKIPFLWNFTQI